MNFLECQFVNTWGLMYLCDIYNPNEKQISPQEFLHSIDWDKIKPYSKLYINTYYLRPLFIVPLFNNLKVPIFLFTGHADTDTTLGNQEAANIILKNSNIILWFSQNCVTIHPKCIKLPIGLDYHTLATVGNPSWGPNMDPKTQELRLIDIIKANINKPKLLKCYANFHFNMKNIKYSHERKEAFEIIPKDIVDYERKFIKREDSWIEQSKYHFVISPPGGGLDCHRTWEALCLGCYPIIKDSPLNPLFMELPVVIVKEWSDITKQLLEEKQKEFSTKTFKFNKLTMKYWKDIIEQCVIIHSRTI